MEELHIPRGLAASAVKAGIKPSGGRDLTLLFSDAPCAAAGTFTTNRIAAAPVQYDRKLVPSASVRAIVINAGNANAATGDQGLANARLTSEEAATLLDITPEQVLVASTGVIGHQLPMELMLAGLESAIGTLTTDAEGLRDAAQAIMTTDTRPKIVSYRRTFGDQEVTLIGLAKGAAMIGPRMATMLAFFLTDARIDPAVLQTILSGAVEDSFNCISVEGHTSTNDTVLILANGQAGQVALEGEAACQFAGLVREACMELARMIPADGEGATHLITIDVEGCRNRDEARTIARAVADSPLVKTAIHGADPNWGRIVSAAGYCGVPFEESELSLWLNGTLLYEAGAPVSFDAEAASASIRANRDVHVRLRFTSGPATIRFWTCDLTAEYVHLNADYTT